MDEMKTQLMALAERIGAQAGGGAGNPGGGSAHRQLPEDLRQEFIAVRTRLFERGLYDPVLVRFDSATAPQATNAEIAAQLTALAESLG